MQQCLPFLKNRNGGIMAGQRNWFVDFIKLIVIHLGLLALFMVGGYVLFCLRSPFPSFVFWTAQGAEGAAGPLFGFLIWLSLLYVRYARKNEADIALAKERTIRDDEPVFICGAVKSVGQILSAPFSGKECAGYCYRVTHTSSEGTGPSRMTTWTDYEGYALSPFVIQSPKGDIRPVPEASKEFYYELPVEKYKASEKRVQEYVRKTDFGAPIKSILGDTSRKKETISEPGNFRFDSAIGDPPEDLDDCTFEERIIQPGEKYYAIGIYKAEGRLLLPDPDVISKPFHIVKGDFTILAKKTRARYIGALICALLALADAAIYFLVIVPKQM